MENLLESIPEKYRPRFLNQFQRLFDLCETVSFFDGKKYELPQCTAPHASRIRSLSSLEEELVSKLPLFDESEDKQLIGEATKIAKKQGIEVTDQRLFKTAVSENPEIGWKLKALGLQNYQRLCQAKFYKNALEIFELGKDYKFSAKYIKKSEFNLFGLKGFCLEEFEYSSSFGYRSVLYHMLRHMSMITGEESSSEIMQLAKSVFRGKDVLELGCGPGFFLYLLKKLGANVTGIDTNDSYKTESNNAGINIVFGDARDLTKLLPKNLLPGKQFDIIFSKDLLSISVTKDYSARIMEEAYRALKKGGFALHQIEYKKRPEEEYLSVMARACKEHGLDDSRIKEVWACMDDEQKECLLRTNVLNISLEHCEEIGYKRLADYLLDAEEFLTIALTK